MGGKNILICITSSYPYGLKETYFHNELLFLSKSYDEVHIIPIYNPTGSKNIRKIPDNCFVQDVIVSQGIMRVFEGLINISPFGNYLIEYFQNSLFLSFLKTKRWINSLLVFRKSHQSIKSFLKSLNKANNITIYSYWAEIPVFTTKILQKYPKVVRMHGGDFYLERNDGYLPLRHEIYNKSELLLPISDNIKSILNDYYLIENDKLFLSRIGVKNTSLYSSINSSNNIFRFASCSNLIPLKRVDLIFEFLIEFSLKNPNYTVFWTHFGDGESMSALQVKIYNERVANLNCTLYGQITQNDLFNYYQNNYFDWFVNFSEYEGIPVSVMEANSFGIPAIATNVGGTSELVNEKNGLLIDRRINNELIIEKIKSLSKRDYINKRIEAYKTWESKYNSDKNYKELLIQFEKLSK